MNRYPIFNSHSWADILILKVFRPSWWYDDTLSLHKDDMLSFAILKGLLSNINWEIIRGVERQCGTILQPGVKIQDWVAQTLLEFKCQLKLNWLLNLLEMYIELINTDGLIET